MDIQNVTIILIVIIVFYFLTPGILINIKGNKYLIGMTHAILFSVIIILIQKIYNPNEVQSRKESLCPALPDCVEPASYRNAVYPWGKKDGTIDNGLGEWTGCAPRTIASIDQRPYNTVYRKDGKTPIKCPAIGNTTLRSFPFLVFDLPGSKGQNATVDVNSISRMNDPPCAYKLDQYCGYANAYDKNGNVIVGTDKYPPQCGSQYDTPIRILENTNLLACLADPQNVTSETVRGKTAQDITNPFFNSVKTGGVGPTYYVSN